MRILFVTNRYPTAETPGDSPCIEQQKQAVERLGHHVDVLVINSRHSCLHYFTALLRIFWLAQIRKRYDLIHAHYGSYCALVACAQWSTPLVVTFRGSDVLNEREYSVSRWVTKRADRVVVMTREMKSLLGRHDAHVVPYGIDPEQFRPGPQGDARESLGLTENVPIVLFPYDPSRTVKRFELVQSAIDLLADEFPDLDLVAIHGKPYQSIPKYMNASDVLVLTSRTEGAPVAVREAMACDLPIVSVDVGDVKEVIGNTEGCFLVKPEPQHIAAHIAEVLQSRSRTDGHFTAEKMSIANAAAEVVQIYKSLVPVCQETPWPASSPPLGSQVPASQDLHCSEYQE